MRDNESLCVCIPWWMNCLREDTVTVTQEIHRMLDEERKRRFIDSIPETIRMILSEYLSSARRATNQTLQADKDRVHFQ